jgi:predicted nucleic acid-binding protein
MPETKEIVINTGPLITLVAAMGDLRILKSLYHRVLVPLEVCREISSGGKRGFASSLDNP